MSSLFIVMNVTFTTPTQRASVLLRNHFVFEHQYFITFRFGKGQKPTNEDEIDNCVVQHLKRVARIHKAHIKAFMGTEPFEQENWNPHAHAIVCSDKEISAEEWNRNWKHGKLLCKPFQPEEYLMKGRQEALSYSIVKHNPTEVPLICGCKHHHRRCRKSCVWNNRSLIKGDIDKNSEILLSMLLGIE